MFLQRMYNKQVPDFYKKDPTMFLKRAIGSLILGIGCARRESGEEPRRADASRRRSRTMLPSASRGSGRTNGGQGGGQRARPGEQGAEPLHAACEQEAGGARTDGDQRRTDGRRAEGGLCADDGQGAAHRGGPRARPGQQGAGGARTTGRGRRSLAQPVGGGGTRNSAGSFRA